LFVGPLGHVQPCCFASESVGNLNDESIDDIWNGPTMVRLRSSIRDGYIDRVCRNAGCKYVRDTESTFGRDAYDFRCESDTEISLCESGGTKHCFSGWSPPEHWGVWSEGEVALLLVDLPERPISDLQLDILCRGVGHEHLRSVVHVEVNGREMDCWHFCYPDSTEQSAYRTIDIPVELMESNRVEVRFLIERPLCPSFGVGMTGGCWELRCPR
jgi:hypothetical protein